MGNVKTLICGKKIEIKTIVVIAVLMFIYFFITQKNRAIPIKFQTKLKKIRESYEYENRRGKAKRIYKKGPGSLPPLVASGPARGKKVPSIILKARSKSRVTHSLIKAILCASHRR